ncbi:hypothetical protein AB0I69_42745 [Streptomyces sp. NPDC050508]|uniref:hypothetical protein n=1 Tax=Streptomyces sp. NPDC050508 TaxID=3155405 RepID=UPI0034179683
MSAARDDGRTDHRTAMFRPLTSPAEVMFAAYSKTAFVPEWNRVPNVPLTRVVSGAFLRALLIDAIRCSGALAFDDLSRMVAFTYAAGMYDHATFECRPMPTPRTPICGECGQWESEHGNPNATCCNKFDVEPRPDTPQNPLCGGCDQPFLHHGRQFTVACRGFFRK